MAGPEYIHRNEGLNSKTSAVTRLPRIHESGSIGVDSTFVYVRGDGNDKSQGMDSGIMSPSLLEPVTDLEHKHQTSKHASIEVKETNKLSSFVDQHTSSFPNRLLLYFGEFKGALESKSQEVGSCVEQFVQELLKCVSLEDKRFVGRLKACGSYYDGLKIKHANEFDYLLELSASNISTDDIDIIQVKPDTCSPLDNPDIYGRSYFKAFFKGLMQRVWLCAECQKENLCDCPHRRELDPRKLQEEFCEAVRTGAAHLDKKWSDIHVKCAGSAIVVHTKLHRDVAKKAGFLNKHGLKKIQQHTEVAYYVLKLNITLAIPVEKPDSSLSWPLEGYGEDLQLNRDMLGDEASIRKCHLVPSGDFWHVSFRHYETQLMHKLTENRWKRHCFQALKHLRDHVSIAGEEDNASQSTYPLKVAFLQENVHHQKDEYWRFWSLSERVKNILNSVRQAEAGKMLTSYFIRNDSVLTEQSRAESRRIIQYVDRMEHEYQVHGAAHFAMFLMLFVGHLVLLCLSCVFLTGDQWASDRFCVDSRQVQGSFAAAHLPLSFISLAASGTGAIFIVVHRLWLRSSSVLYDMYRGTVYVYLVIVIIDALLAGFGIGLAVTLKGLYDPECGTRARADAIALAFCSVCLCAIVVLLMVCHVVLYLVSIRGKLQHYMWEVVLSDYIYKEAFPCLQRNTRDPPRVSVSVNKKENLAEDMDTDSEDTWDDPVSTLERKRHKMRRQVNDDPTTPNKQHSHSNGHEHYDRPISVTQVQQPPEMHTSQKSRSEPTESPIHFDAVHSSPSSPTHKINNHGSLNGFPGSATTYSPGTRYLNDPLNQSYSSLNSRASAPPSHLTVTNEKLSPSKRLGENSRLSKPERGKVNRAYETSPNRHSSTSEPCLVTEFKPMEAGVARTPSNVLPVILDELPKVNTRFVDVPI